MTATPKYIKIAKIFEEAIKEGRYKDKLPPFSKLQTDFNISQATLSMAINELEKEGYIVRERRKGVFIRKHRLKYKRTNTVDMILPQVMGNVFSETIQAAHDHLYELGYKLNLRITPENRKEEIKQIIESIGDESKGTLLLTRHDTPDRLSAVRRLIEEKPLVQVDREILKLDADFVAVDSKLGTKFAVQKIIKKGYDKVGILRYLKNELEATKRYNSYIETLEKNNIKPLKEWSLVVFPDNEDNTLLNVEKFFSNTDVRCFYAINNSLARCAIDAATKLGFTAGRDYELIGFDVRETVDRFSPKITYFNQPMTQVVAQAVQLLHERINGYKCPARRIMIPPTFVEGETFVG